ncbi:MAG TPA: AMP-binding protein [Acidimicrobiales bacterium]|nr:AMP-binding protein [Acidimicrobiales bacterium]
MPELVAIAIPTGPRFLAELTRVWDEGNAVLPVDPRLPMPAVAALLEAMRPSVLVDEAGERQRLHDPRPVEPGDALVVATSGTTGAPKGVVLTHAAVEASARATSARLRVEPSVDRWLAVLPVAHIGGLSVLTRALTTGTPVTFDVDDPAATLTAMVPTQLERHDTSRFRVVLAGGSADWRERSTNVVHTYGMTETGSGIAYDGVALDGVEMRIGDDGEILVRGPMLLRCYRDGSDPKGPDGWLATGDEGELDDEGRIVVHGRRGEVIVTGGEKVWPAPVEAAIRELPDVADVAVVGLADPEWGQRVVAYVVPAAAAGEIPLDLARIREAVKKMFPAYMAPRELHLRNQLPRTAMGKIRRSSLGESR